MQERVEQTEFYLKNANAKSMQETVEQRELGLEKVNAKSMQETVEQREVYIEKIICEEDARSSGANGTLSQ